MIPFSLAGGKLHSDGETLEFSFLSLSPKCFTFQVPKRICFTEETKIDTELWFLSGTDEKFARIELKKLYPSLAEEQNWSRVYSVTPESREYTDAVNRFSKEYLAFVRLKTELSEEELALEVLGGPEEQCYAESVRAFEQQILENKAAKRDWLTAAHAIPETAIWLKSPNRYPAFLGLPFQEYCKEYWKEHFLSGHPASELTINCIYIGSEQCVMLLPKPETFLLLLKKSREEQLLPVLVLPPLGEIDLQYVKELLPVLCDSEGPGEIAVNDIGTAEFVLQQLRAADRRDWKLRYGTIPNRNTKDARGLRLSKTGGEPNLLQDPLYSGYLASHGIRHLSADFLSNVKFPEKTALHLPYQRTNQSACCTLRACIEEGDRGKQKKTEHCPRYCEQHALMYPQYLRCIGYGNALFVLEDILFESIAWPDCKPERLVFNL